MYRQNKKGVSLAELVLYVGMVAVVVPALMYFYNGYIQASKKTEIASHIELEGRRITAQLHHFLSVVDTVSSPSLDATTSSITFTSKAGYTYTQIYLSSGDIYVVDGSGAHQLNSDDVVITNLQYTYIDGADEQYALRYGFDASYESNATRNEYNYTQSFSGQINKLK